MAVIEALERQEQLRGLGRANGWLAAALAALTLVSWWLGVPFAAGPASLKPQTCIAILLLVGALELAARASLPRRAHALQAVLAGAGGAIAVLALVEHGLGRDLGIAVCCSGTRSSSRAIPTRGAWRRAPRCSFS
jgi:hypothetical protein